MLFGLVHFLKASTPLIVNNLTHESPQKEEVWKTIFRSQAYDYEWFIR